MVAKQRASLDVLAYDEPPGPFVRWEDAYRAWWGGVRSLRHEPVLRVRSPLLDAGLCVCSAPDMACHTSSAAKRSYGLLPLGYSGRASPRHGAII